MITTNGTIKTNGRCVMGRGCAKEAKDMYPELDLGVGRYISKIGNHVGLLERLVPAKHHIGIFPVKHNWWEKADLKLIQRSAQELQAMINTMPEIAVVVMPRPGCGNGHLNWEEVKPVIEPYLDSRFVVVTFGSQAEIV